MKNKEKMAKILTVVCLVVALILSPSTVYHTSADPESKVMALYANERRFDINGVSYELSDDILLYYSNIFIPIDDILPKCGFNLGWDASLPATVAIKDGVTSYIIMNSPVLWVGPERFEYDLPTMVYHDRLYMSLAMFSDLTNIYVTLDGKLEETEFNKRDLLLGAYVSDAYRLPNTNISYAGGVTMAGNFAFERVGISADNAVNYAHVVNAVAASLPGAKTYNMVVPTSGEFYAPVEMAPYQTDAIRIIYQNLSPNVTPINAVKPLMEHAGEKIYFSTDHHWTQRGAYYAYKAFAANKGWTVPELSAFATSNSTTHVGSFANFTKGTALSDKIHANPELLERFLPVVDVQASTYRDMYMTKKIGNVSAVSTNVSSYSCFIGGDNPLTVMTTNVNNGKKLVIIKESFGNAFATWALNNYQEVYVVDPRKFNGFGGNHERFNLIDFYDFIRFDDLVIINYPVSVGSTGIRESILKMVR